MPVKRFSPHRGLLAGLLALVTFASGAVALTAHGSNAVATQATGTGATQAPAGDGDGDRREAAFRRHER